MYNTILMTLPNGLRLALHPMPSTYSATVVAVVGTGSRYEDDAQGGISHFLEHMLFKGTRHWPSARQISDTIERLGGRLNASTSREVTSYYTKVPSRHVDTGLDLIADMLRHPLIDPSEVERETGVILEELAQGEDVPATVGAHLLQRTLWGAHPLGRPIIGSRESVSAVTAGTLRAPIGAPNLPPRTVLSVAGNVDPDALTPRIEELFGDWPAAPAPGTLPAVYPTAGERATLARRDGQAHLYIAAPGLSMDHPDYMAFAILAEILGGGMSSRLFAEVRERRGLAYSVGASAGAMSDHGALAIHAGVAPAKALGALEVILRELHRLSVEPVGGDELERVRGHYEGTLLLALEDSYSVAVRNGRSVLQRGYARTPEESLALVEQVGADDIQRLAAAMTAPDDLRLTVVGPFDDVTPFADVIAAPISLTALVSAAEDEAGAARTIEGPC